MFYTYLIVNNITKMFYYGARYSEKAKLDDLFTSYFTSSKRVKKDIDKYGKEDFSFEIRRIFSTAEDCLKWEYKVLRRLKAKDRDDCYNLSNGGAVFNCSKSMKMNNPMTNPESLLKSVEGKKKSRAEGRHKKSAPSADGCKRISKRMRENNPMKNPEFSKRMAQTKQANGNTCANTVWMANLELQKRKRVRMEDVEKYLEMGWVQRGNKVPFIDVEVCQ